MAEDKKFVVKCSPELFDRMKVMRHIPLRLMTIVQNDMEISEDEIKEFKQEVKNFRDGIQEWWLDVLKHIDKCNAAEPEAPAESEMPAELQNENPE